MNDLIVKAKQIADFNDLDVEQCKDYLNNIDIAIYAIDYMNSLCKTYGSVQNKIDCALSETAFLAYEFYTHKITKKNVKLGLAKLINCNEKPSVSEFVKLCLPDIYNVDYYSKFSQMIKEVLEQNSYFNAVAQGVKIIKIVDDFNLIHDKFLYNVYLKLCKKHSLFDLQEINKITFEFIKNDFIECYNQTHKDELIDIPMPKNLLTNDNNKTNVCIIDDFLLKLVMSKVNFFTENNINQFKFDEACYFSKNFLLYLEKTIAEINQVIDFKDKNVQDILKSTLSKFTSAKNILLDDNFKNKKENFMRALSLL